MKKLLNLMAIFTIMPLLSGCGGGEVAKSAATPTPTPSNKIAIIGSTTLLPILSPPTHCRAAILAAGVVSVKVSVIMRATSH